jgi:hypothetical protein
MFFLQAARARYHWFLCNSFMLLLFAYTPNSYGFGVTFCVRPDGRNSCYTTISAAVAAASYGDIVQVYSGTYNEEVFITDLISLVAADHAEVIIDASGKPYGIFVNGLSSAPQPGIGRVFIHGLKIRNAQFEGILIANASNVTVAENEVTHNNLALDTGSGTCPGLPDFETNEGDDCGEGIHLMGVDHSSVVRNEVWDNAGGILLTDETGPNHSNFIAENYVHDNPSDGGITIASHAPATSVIPSATASYGVYNNTVAHNRSWSNGNKVPGGAGIGIFALGPDSAYANVVIDNDIRRNGMAGVAMHSDFDLNDNQILGNYLAGNGADLYNPVSFGPTGISIWSTSVVIGITVLANRFEDEAVDIVYGYVGQPVLAHLNNFSRGIGTSSHSAGVIDDYGNWWDCPSGPVIFNAGPSPSGPCAGDQTRLPDIPGPWLTHPFPYPYDIGHDQDEDHEH